MNKKKDDTNEEYLGLFFILFIVLILGLMIYATIQDTKVDDFCKEKGYIASSFYNNESIVCYNYNHTTILNDEGQIVQQKKIYTIIPRGNIK